MSEYDSSTVEPDVQTAAPTSLAWNQIRSAGTYVCNWSGHLLRVPPESISHDGTPGFNIVGADPLFVTKISDDPELNLHSARQSASELNLTIGF